MHNPLERVAKMVQAIKNEAKEKAEQIQENAMIAYKIERNKIIYQQRELISEEYKRKMESYTIEKRKARSNIINNFRLSKMNVRFELVEKLKEELKLQLAKMIKNQTVYRLFLKNLIIQGLIKLMETKVELRCFSKDIDLIESMSNEIEKDFSEIIRTECGRDIKCKISINKRQPLEQDGKYSIGGIILSCNENRIVCSNTIEDRLELSFQEFLPDIRNGLFSEYKK